MKEKVYNLVKKEFEKMKLSKETSNQTILLNKCQAIIYNEWGISNNNLWSLIADYVKEFIPDEMD